MAKNTGKMCFSTIEKPGKMCHTMYDHFEGAVIAAGSLLGALLAKPKSYPVGMVNLLDVFPLGFDEFLEAYNNYLIIGGMPECVASWVQHKDPARISQIQRELVEVYENDFSKHNGKVNSGRILMVFRSIVSQLAKSNEEFMYGAIRKGGYYYETYLRESGGTE